MISRTYTVQGMSCQHCVDAIHREVSALLGVHSVSVDLAAETVTVTGEQLDDKAVRAAIDEAGYQVVI